MGVRSLYKWTKYLWGKQSNMWSAHPTMQDEKVQEHWGLELDVYWHINNYYYKIIEVKKQDTILIYQELTTSINSNP